VAGSRAPGRVACGTPASAFARGSGRRVSAGEGPTRARPGEDPIVMSRSGLSSLRCIREGLGMHINYEIPDDLHHRAKALAALEGKTLREFIVEALTEAVARREGGGTATGGSGRRG
jgi:hypothetical protein